MTLSRIPFNKPYMTGKELYYIAEAHFNGTLAGDGPFTKKCHEWLSRKTDGAKSLLTHSCTAALEMAALLCDIKQGDEIIMPSYTFVSTANAFVLRGGIPVFVDIRPDTLNIDEKLIESAVTKRTKAIAPVHYAGVGCEMDIIMPLAEKHGLFVVEDAAQGIMSEYNSRPLGTFGDFGAFSFHETKNVICGEGGALIINNGKYAEEAEIIREKGTDRSRFFRGQVDKYTWQEHGSSFLPGELTAAFLWAQLEEADKLTDMRLKRWDFYYELFEDMENRGLLKRPFIPQNCRHNAHMFYIILNENTDRGGLLNHLKSLDINATFHYVPLHSSPGGQKYGRTSGNMKNTDTLSARLVRLPLFNDITESDQTAVCEAVKNFLERS